MSKLSAAFFALLLCGLAACASQTGGGLTTGQPNGFTLPPVDGDLAISAAVPAKTIGEELPAEGVGSVHSAQWRALVGGFTEKQYAQVLAFPPGTKITIKNLSKTTEHTFDVVKVIDGPPAHFPRSPTLSFSRQGGDKLEGGYASGIIKPGRSVTVILVKGIYLIGCAFHYGQGMRDVLVVEKNVKPGPQGTPTPAPPTPTPVPTATPTPGGTPTPYVSPTPTPTPTPMIVVSPSAVTVCASTATCAHATNTATVHASLSGSASTTFTVDDTGCSRDHWAKVTPSTGTSATVFTITGENWWPGLTCNVQFTGGGGGGTLPVTLTKT